MISTNMHRRHPCIKGVLTLLYLSRFVRILVVWANPLSNPYIAFRTDPYDQTSSASLLKAGSDPTTLAQQEPLVQRIDWSSIPNAQAAQERSNIVSLSKTTTTTKNGKDASSSQCPLQFQLGVSKRLHGDDTTLSLGSVVAPPTIYPVFPGRGPGKQVVTLSSFETLDLLTPASLSITTASKTLSSSSHRHMNKATYGSKHAASSSDSSSSSSVGAVKEILVQGTEFPLLMESSSFLTQPILHDVNGDGLMDAILTDYDGGIHIVGLVPSAASTSGTTTTTTTHRHRYLHHAQVPRMYIRREWIERRVHAQQKHMQQASSADNVTTHDEDMPHDPYHTYFEYYYTHPSNHDADSLLKGVSANVLEQESHHVQEWYQRKQRHVFGGKQQQHSVMERHELSLEEQKQVLRQEETAILEEEMRHEEEVLRDLDAQEAEEANTYTAQEPNEQAEQEWEAQRAQANANIMDDLLRQQEEDYEELTLGRERPRDMRVEDQEFHKREREKERQEHLERLERLREELDEHAHEVQQPGVSAEIAVEDANELRTELKERLLEQQDQLLANQGKMHRRLEEVDPGLYDDPAYDDKPNGGDRAEDIGVSSYDDLAMDDPYYGREGHGDDYDYRGRRDYDDYYGGYNQEHQEYYDTRHYIRIPPHILCSPVLAEIPKMYSNKNEKEDILFLAVSYYLDEDEYEGLFSYKRFESTDQGDENEVRRGTFVANAIVSYVLGSSPRWSGQTNLDLSTDFTAPENATLVDAIPIHSDVTQMGAFALGSPTVADIDGDGNMDVLLGTSMGIVYAFDARQMFKKGPWPIQMNRPIESRILVEDVIGDTNLEVFVADIGGNVVCFDHLAKPIWHRNLTSALGQDEYAMTGSSSMALGDVDGDGRLDLVLVVRIQNHQSYMFAMDAASGKDLPYFPIQLDELPDTKSKDDEEVTPLHRKLPMPLLVDLHGDQSFLEQYIRRNATTWHPRRPRKVGTIPTHGGGAPGLHIVYPEGKTVYVIEGGSGCSQTVSIGDEVSAMVQVDDVHGTNRLDLVVTTEAGDTITLESSSPYHPLNTWNRGELRGRTNSHAHGYSASQGIFVHESSRQYIDVFGIYVPVTIEIFDNRPNIRNEPDKRQYLVEIRDGTSWDRALFRAEYSEPGVYKERVYVRFGPGYYTLNVIMTTSHGLMYEDSFHIGYNPHFMSGFGVLLWLPLMVVSATIFFCGAKKSNWEDAEDDLDSDRGGHNLGILGRAMTSD